MIQGPKGVGGGVGTLVGRLIRFDPLTFKSSLLPALCFNPEYAGKRKAFQRENGKHYDLFIICFLLLSSCRINVVTTTRASAVPFSCTRGSAYCPCVGRLAIDALSSLDFC